ncbi:DUF5930 domain-containing protein [Paracoccus sanguinis]|uniref:DUF5930 domain-containing protein n=1 Tax=Paracoccus sanguinis TaxID=1545044 RepID=UPI0014513923|nr:DUF5930 domain-containing protein [Paracoccus sanguinis]QJD17463.1 peptidoglycan DD-metalloendopeptidase family protein [Paracoccus sanguinis]
MLRSTPSMPAATTAADPAAARSGRGVRIARRAGFVAVVGWAAVSTSILAFDRMGPGAQAAAQPDMALFERQMTELSAERDARAAEAAAAQTRFTAALSQVSQMQSQLLASEEKRRELESGIGAMQASLHDARADAQEALRQLADATSAADAAAPRAERADEMKVALDILSGELETAASDRAAATKRADEATRTAQALTVERDEIMRRNEEIFAQLEEAVELSVKPLDDMFAKVGVNTDKLLETVRQGYEGTGGPLTPMGYSSRGNAAISESEARANEVVISLGKVNNYRIAVSKLPLAMPVKSAFRFTSPFGKRWGRAHEGIDLAGPVGTPIYATGDGVVIFAGWQRGYGNVIKIKHAVGTETRYGHLSKIRVKAGQQVSRNSLIGDMGNTGRSTGPHLHYEVRVDGKAVNPMSFIKAAQNVF